MKNWKVPAIILALLIIAIIFRWGDLGSSTTNGITTKTKVDRWNGTVWQVTVKNGSYVEKIVSPSWVETNRKPIEKQIEYEEPDFLKPLPKDPNLKYQFKQYETITKTKTVYEAPPPIYWLSRNGLTKIWGWLMLISVIWLLYAVSKNKKNVTNENKSINT